MKSFGYYRAPRSTDFVPVVNPSIFVFPHVHNQTQNLSEFINWGLNSLNCKKEIQSLRSFFSLVEVVH